MRRGTMLVAVVGLALASASCGGDDGAGAASATVALAELNSSGITGTATLTSEDGTTKVVVTLEGAGAGPQPIHIHPGSCADLDPAPQYPLRDVANGASETSVEVSLDSLRAGAFAINVHKSAQEAQTYVACGDIA